eukprot:NODE_1439_length_2477_cov_7.934468.p1 GENE.NODE_1439_length_2477_cov_7.934468~~NODE_1439_length_2477_cov_7.934468.p1  ORF type:complete len:739 (+),score=170.61 NODE_1439_length_2477_cov_7.934468:88-2217(+)
MDSAVVRPFATVPDSMFTLFRVMSGASSESEAYALDTLMAEIPTMKFGFVFFMIASSWTLLSILTAVVSENMITTTSGQEEERRIQTADEDRIQHILHLEDLFRSMDTSGDGLVQPSEIETFLSDSQNALSTAKLCKVPHREVLDVLDTIKHDTKHTSPDGGIKICEFADVLVDVGKTVTERSVLKILGRLALLQQSLNGGLAGVERIDRSVDMIWSALGSQTAVAEGTTDPPDVKAEAPHADDKRPLLYEEDGMSDVAHKAFAAFEAIAEKLLEFGDHLDRTLAALPEMFAASFSQAVTTVVEQETAAATALVGHLARNAPAAPPDKGQRNASEQAAEAGRLTRGSLPTSGRQGLAELRGAVAEVGVVAQPGGDSGRRSPLAPSRPDRHTASETVAASPPVGHVSNSSPLVPRRQGLMEEFEVVADSTTVLRGSGPPGAELESSQEPAPQAVPVPVFQGAAEPPQRPSYDVVAGVATMAVARGSARPQHEHLEPRGASPEELGTGAAAAVAPPMSELRTLEPLGVNTAATALLPGGGEASHQPLEADDVAAVTTAYAGNAMRQLCPLEAPEANAAATAACPNEGRSQVVLLEALCAPLGEASGVDAVAMAVRPGSPPPLSGSFEAPEGKATVTVLFHDGAAAGAGAAACAGDAMAELHVRDGSEADVTVLDKTTGYTRREPKLDPGGVVARGVSEPDKCKLHVARVAP